MTTVTESKTVSDHNPEGLLRKTVPVVTPIRIRTDRGILFTPREKVAIERDARREYINRMSSKRSK